MNRLVLASLLSLSACGGSGVDGTSHDDSGNPSDSTGAAPSQSFGPTLVTLSGLIEGSSLPKLPSKVRVAVVWPVSGSDHEAEGVDVDLSHGLPARYVLNVSSLPPDAVMRSATSAESSADGADLSGVEYAAGALIAYVDVDGDGKRASDGSEPIVALPTAPASLPAGAGVNEWLYFVQGTPPAHPVTTSNGARTDTLLPGFNVVQFGASGVDGAGQPVPADTVTVPLADDIDLELGPTYAPSGTLICSSGFGALASAPSAPTDPQTSTLPPAGATVFCSNDGEIIAWSKCQGTICDETCTSGTDVLSDPSNPPAGWPCTISF